MMVAVVVISPCGAGVKAMAVKVAATAVPAWFSTSSADGVVLMGREQAKVAVIRMRIGRIIFRVDFILFIVGKKEIN
jgi:hypothetical protein